MQRLACALSPLLILAACGGPNDASGTVAGESFGKAAEAIFVMGDEEDGNTYLTALITNYESACSNYQYYVELNQYDSRNPYADTENLPHHLALSVSLPGSDISGEHEVLTQGAFYDGGPYFVYGNYEHVTEGESLFSTVKATGGSVTVESWAAEGPLVAEFDVSFEDGGTLTGSMEAVLCEP